MSTWAHVDIYADDRELAVADLGKSLFRGELALFLGGGASAAFGFPSWPALVRDCLTAVGEDSSAIHDNASFDVLTKGARAFRDAAISEANYLETVKKYLYEKARARAQMSGTPLLNALGALMMGSRRGRVREVWTLNFDDVIEWHLRVHGFVSQVITKVPTLLRDVDVTVHHPHGYLPLDDAHGERSSDIVFDDRSYAKRSVGRDEPWRHAVQTALRSKVFLAVGLSWTDRLMTDLVIDASTEIVDRPTAFWFFGPDCTPAQIKECLSNNVVPLKFDSFDAYIPFILRVCESAMDSVN